MIESPPHIWAIAVSITSVLVAFASLLATYFLWRRTQRPFVFARVVTSQSGEIATALNLVVESTGPRPAFEVRVILQQSDIDDAISPDATERDQRWIEALRDEASTIPVIRNGQSVSAAIGIFRAKPNSSTWKPGYFLPVRIEYRDMDDRRFKTKMRLKLLGNESFTGLHWSPIQRSSE